MKKIFSLGLMLVALTLMNCSKEEIAAPANEGANFELFASAEDGRTVNDGWSTVWAKGDQINVFHAEKGSTAYSNDKNFTIQDVDAGLFTGTVTGTLTAEAYDWYLFYPYSSYVTTPASTSSGFMPVGSKSNAAQTQTGNNSTAHIAGPNYPLYGKAVAPANETPVVTMKHLTSLVEFEVKNATDKAFKVTSIQFTSATDIVGTYYINFAGDEVEFKGSGDSYVSKTATLNVTNGEEIAAGTKAKFYMAVKPHAVEAGKLTIKVTTNTGSCEKVLENVTTTFTAGMIKNIGVNCEIEAAEPGDNSINGDYVIVAKSSEGYCAMSADADNKRRAYQLLTDFAPTAENYTTDNANLIWTISATATGYSISNNGKYLSWSSENVANLQATAYSVAITAQTDGTYKITTDSGNRILAKNADKGLGFAFYGTANTTGVTKLYLVPATYIQLPTLTWGTESTSLEYDDTTVHTLSLTTDATEVTVAAYDDIEGTTASSWLTASYSEGKVTFAAKSINETDDIRAAYLIATTTNANGSKKFSIPVTQAKKPAAGGAETEVTYDFTKFTGFSSWNSSYSKREAKYDEATVVFSSANKQSGTITNMPVTKGQPVELKMKEGTIKAVKFVCKQWKTKTQTITLHYSINGGTSYTSTNLKSSTFSIEKTDLPAGTNAVKITFSSSDNQVGISSVTYTYMN